MKLARLLTLICLIYMLTLNGMASGQCVPDGNDTALDAATIGLNETVSDYVCPDDLFDFYTFEVPDGAEVAGSISLASEQVSTVLRLENLATGERIISDWSTNDERNSFSYPITASTLAPGTYIIRISFWSAAAYDHEYTLTTDLSITWLGDCIPDDNEAPEDAGYLAFGSSVSDWVCDIDHLDIWHFTVSGDAQGTGKIKLTANPGELILYLYDDASTELYQERTSSGTLTYNLGEADDQLADGDYYIGVFLPTTRDDENSYTLSLHEYVAPLTFDGIIFEMHAFVPYEPEPEPPSIEMGDLPLVAMAPLFEAPKAPWPMISGGPYNTGASGFSGPRGEMYEATFYYFNDDYNDLVDGSELYRWLLVGADDQVFVCGKSGNKFHVFEMTPRVPRYCNAFTMAGAKEPCLDSQGNFYCITTNGKLTCYDSFDFWTDEAHKKWEVDLPGAVSDIAVEAVGNKIYTSSFDDGWYVHAWSKSGSALWNYGPFDSPIVDIAKGNFATYVQTEQSFSKFDTGGARLWHMPFPSLRGERAMVHDNFPPMIRKDGYIMVDNKMTDYEFTFTPNGGIAGTSWSYSELSKESCLGRDGHHYSVNSSDYLYCYEPTSSSPIAWSKRLDGDTCDLILDKDDFIYVLYRHQDEAGVYTYRIEILDGNNEGELVYTEVISNVSQGECELNLPGELAIGSDGKLIVLLGAGYLYAFHQYSS